jgi:phospholipase/carboxylesterase
MTPHWLENHREDPRLGLDRRDAIGETSGRQEGSVAACRLLIALAALLASCGEGADSPMPTTRPEPHGDWIERVVQQRRTEVGRRPPLLILLHGIGADENDLLPIAGELDPHLKVVSLRAPRRYHTGYAWFQIDFGPSGGLTPHVAEARETLADLVRWLESAPERHDTDPARTFVLGFSQGAMMALGVLRTAPELLAGVVALSGRSPEGLFEARASREAVARVPLLVAHGTRDDVLPIVEGRRTRDAFAPLSTDFTYREYPVGHGVGPAEVALVGQWLTARLDRQSGSPHR